MKAFLNTVLTETVISRSNTVQGSESGFSRPAYVLCYMGPWLPVTETLRCTLKRQECGSREEGRRWSMKDLACKEPYSLNNPEWRSEDWIRHSQFWAHVECSALLTLGALCRRRNVTEPGDEHWNPQAFLPPPPRPFTTYHYLSCNI